MEVKYGGCSPVFAKSNNKLASKKAAIWAMHKHLSY